MHFMSEIKATLEHNQLLLLLFPFLAQGKKWTDNEITIIGMTETRKEASVTALGYGGALTGLHFWKIIVDDIVDFENSRTEHQRNKVIEWIGLTLMPMLREGPEESGEIHWNGTRYHQKDLYDLHLKAGITTNENSHRAIINEEKGEVLWPELFPLKRLLAIRKKPTVGSLRFNAQYQNDTQLMKAGVLFKSKNFKYFWKIAEDIYEDQDGNKFGYRDLAIFQTCDLAISKKVTADYFAVLTFGLSKAGNFYIFNVYRKRLTPGEQAEFIVSNYMRWKAARIGIEATQFQVMMQQEVNKNSGVAARPLYPNLDKVTRSITAQTKYETGKIFHNQNMSNLEDFETELTIFPEGDNDDMVDCVGYMPGITQATRIKVGVN